MRGQTPRETAQRAELGRRAEALVGDLLVGRGFAILARNARVGRLELDLVARKSGLVVFCEVRARASDAIVDPAETIGRDKQARVRRAAIEWLRASRLGNVDIRFDAASVVFDRDPPRVTYYEEAF